MWLDHLPASVAFCDVETTGLGNHDRIVSFGGIGMISRDLAKGRPDLAYLYLVFDPGMGNHRNAEQIQRFSERGLPPHQARSCWRSARRDRGRLARDADLLLAARLPASGSIARLAPLHSIQLPSR